MELKPNMIFRYGCGKWARHGLAVVVPWGSLFMAADTYWCDPNMHRLSPEEIAKAEYLGNLDDYRASNRDDAERYKDCDVIFIPIGGRSEQWWVRKEASPDTDRVINQLRWKISEQKAKADYAQREANRLEQELARYNHVN